MQRRQFIRGVGAGSLALGAADGGLRAAQARSGNRWRMATTWPDNFPGLGTGANQLATLIGAMSGGRVQVQVDGAGELVPAAAGNTGVNMGGWFNAIVLNACKVTNQEMPAEFTARNPAALNTVVTKPQVELRCFPDDVIHPRRARADEVVAGLAQQDAFAAKVHASDKKCLVQAKTWSDISAFAYLQARDQA